MEFAKAEVKAILEKYGLRKTNCRLDVLQLLLSKKHALAHADIEEALGDRYDRVTLYRTLYTFEEKGLLHGINDSSGAAKYALCHESCDEHQHQDNHIHFSCTTCGQTYCINEVQIPKIQLPKGYKAASLQFTAQGICKNCSAASI
ncbi:Fur family transcriptional regulator [Pontibacter harenae]|uniref:Fur family transcriptional regulator n=1 Tax=Pontibacter harenae TaxID=2894083 RepID=UPI001E35253F|nr:transcriptional repressor [Pontibacter harenae]MCC9167760.1 transcriptional repressor [Pontibacter harenae]